LAATAAAAEVHLFVDCLSVAAVAAAEVDLFVDGLSAATATAAEVDLFVDGLLAARATAAEVDCLVSGCSAAAATAAEVELFVDCWPAATVTVTAAEVDLFVDGLLAATATAAEVDCLVSGCSAAAATAAEVELFVDCWLAVAAMVAEVDCIVNGFLAAALSPVAAMAASSVPVAVMAAATSIFKAAAVSLERILVSVFEVLMPPAEFKGVWESTHPGFFLVVFLEPTAGPPDFLEGGNRFLLRLVGLVIASVASSAVEAGELAATLFLMRVDTRLGLAVAIPFPPLDVGDMMMFMMVVRVMGNKILFEVHTDAGEQTNMQVGSQIDLGGILKHIFSKSQ
jgi:hypothetical protein